MEQKPFFRPGGTLDPTALSYRARSADGELYQALLNGDYVFLLDSRQKGKSSLVARTIVKLKEQGVVSVKLDLQRIGANLTPEQWYAGLLNEIGQDVGLTKDLFDYWAAHQSVGPLARWVGALGDVLLKRVTSPIVVFVDEVDYVKSLPFSTDEFFAAIRDCFNRRADNSEFSQLTFCLVGVATPGQLIRNPEITPFNIGRRIDLHDFELDELQGYTEALRSGNRDGPALLSRVVRWTNGHPYLTQVVCSEIAADTRIVKPSNVDQLVSRLFFSSEARQRESNLADVERRLLDPDIPGLSGDERRSQVLDVYRQLIRGKRVELDEENPLFTTLQLSGVATADNGSLRLRNNIYGTVFNEAWRRSNLPEAEVRRQQAAEKRAVVRTTLIASAILAVMASFVVWNIGLAKQATAERDAARYESYCSSMISTSQLWEDNYWQGIADIVGEQKDNPARGWEWDYWNYLSRNHALPGDDQSYDYRWSRDGKTVVTRRRDGIAWIEPSTGKTVHQIDSPTTSMSAAFELPDNRVLDVSWGGWLAVWDIKSKRLLWRDPIPQVYWRPNGVLDPSGRYFLGGVAGKLWRYDLTARKVESLAGDGFDDKATFGGDGSVITVIRSWIDNERKFAVGILDPQSLKLKRTLSVDVRPTSAVVDPTGTVLVVGTSDGGLTFLDLRTFREIYHSFVPGGAAWRMDFSRDGKHLSVGTTGSVTRVFELDGWNVRVFGDIRGVTDAYWDESGQNVLAIYFQARVIPVGEIATSPVHVDRDSACFIDPINSTLTALNSSHAQVFDLTKLNPAPQITTLVGTIDPRMRLMNGTPFIVCKTSDDSIVLEGKSLKKVATVPKQLGSIVAYCSIPRTQKAVVVLEGGGVRLYDRQSQTLTPLEVKSAAGVTVSPSGRYVVFAGDSFTISIWDTEQKTWIHSNRFGPGVMHDCVFTKDEKRFIGAFDSGYLQLVDVTTGEIVRTFRQHSGNARCLAVSPDERRVASGGDDRAIRIWDFQTGRLLTVLRGHTADPYVVAFIEGGKTIASVDLDGNVQRWRTHPYEPDK